MNFLFVTQTVGPESFKFHPQPWGSGGILWWNYHYPQRHTGNNHHGSLVTEAPTALTLCRYPVVIGIVPEHKALPNHGLTSFQALSVHVSCSVAVKASIGLPFLPVCYVTRCHAVPMHGGGDISWRQISGCWKIEGKRRKGSLS